MDSSANIFNHLNNTKAIFKGIWNDPSGGMVVWINDIFYHLVEDENDGYRSYLISTQVEKPKNAIFSLESFPVKCHCQAPTWEDFMGLILYTDTVKDEKAEIFAQFGTRHHDDYYPMCVLFLDLEILNKHLLKEKIKNIK